ncbi:MAG TPA: hypothetical protein VJ739_16495 [Gemmataceae bacterium]|nr:hypothetical protein [Gemmataceae bacterium]
MTEAQELRRLYWWSFGLRSSFALTGWLLTVLLDLHLLDDAGGYEARGAQVADCWLSGQASPWLAEAMQSGRSAWVMVVVIAALYCVMGGIRAVPVLIALFCLITSWTPVFVYKIARQLGQRPGSARVGAWVVALGPAFAFWSGALYKEGLILLVLSLATYHTLVLQERLRVASLVILLGCLAALSGLRFYLAVMMTLLLGAGLLLGRIRGGAPGAAVGVILRQLVIALAFVGAMTAVGLDQRLQHFLPADTHDGLEQIQKSRNDLAEQASGYFRHVKISNPEEALAFLPTGTFYFLTVPFPWDLGSLRQNLAIPETLCWVFLYPVVALGAWQGLRRNAQGTILLLMAIVSISCFYGLFAGNVGTAFRMRIQVWMFCAVFLGWGFEAVRRLRGVEEVLPTGERRSHARARPGPGHL